MKPTVLIAHAKGEEDLAEVLAGPLREANYNVTHRGTVPIGESFINSNSQALRDGSPVVFCGTCKAIGGKWARHIVRAARSTYCPIYCVQMDEEADTDLVSPDESIALYWQDSNKAIDELISALDRRYSDGSTNLSGVESNAENRYRQLALECYDIINLTNLPEDDRHIATRQLKLRQLYVPLHVRVESGAEVESADSDLQAMEKRRTIDRSQTSSWGFKSPAEPENPLDRIAVGERLEKAQRLIVLGDPGAGKTTMTQWIATAYLLRLKQDPDWKDLPDVSSLPDFDWLPIIIRCRDLDSTCVSGSLYDMLGHSLRKAEMTESEARVLQDVLCERLRKGQAILMIDGLDEIPDASLRAQFCRQVEQIAIANPNAPIIVTSRIVGYREMGYRIGRGFEHVTVADLSEEEKDEFARRWCSITEPPDRHHSAAIELIEDIHSTDRIERLTGNPMLLTTMALVKPKSGPLR